MGLNIKCAGMATLAMLLGPQVAVAAKKSPEWELSLQAYGFHYETQSVYTTIPSPKNDIAPPKTGGGEGPEGARDHDEREDGGEQHGGGEHEGPELGESPHPDGPTGHHDGPPRPATGPDNQPPPPAGSPGVQSRQSRSIYEGHYAALVANRTLNADRGWKNYLSLKLNLTDYYNLNSYDDQQASLALYHKRWGKGQGWRAGVTVSENWRAGMDHYSTYGLSAYGYHAFTPSSFTTLSANLERTEYARAASSTDFSINGWDREVTLGHTMTWKSGLIPDQKSTLNLSTTLGEEATEGGIYDSNRFGWKVELKQNIAGGHRISLRLKEEVIGYPEAGGRPYSGTLKEEDERSVTLKYLHTLNKRFKLYLSTGYTDTRTNDGVADSEMISLYFGVMASL